MALPNIPEPPPPLATTDCSGKITESTEGEQEIEQRKVLIMSLLFSPTVLSPGPELVMSKALLLSSYHSSSARSSVCIQPFQSS